MDAKERRAQFGVAFWLLLALAGSIVFAAGFALGANTQVEGAGLGVGCLGIAIALILWSRGLMPHESAVDERHDPRSADPEQREAIALMKSGVQVVARRTWLVRLGFAAATALGIAALFPFRAFGPSPNGRIAQSDWRSGLRLVSADGSPVSADMLDVGSALTAFPESDAGTDDPEKMGLDAVMVVRVETDYLQLPAERTGWAPNGYLAYSKICTHLGCPLGLYRQRSRQLVCPCHQSVFNVVDGGSVVFGPAARPLPQLPLQLDADGTLRAAGPMSDYIGADNWNYGA